MTLDVAMEMPHTVWGGQRAELLPTGQLDVESRI
jgi:hypothetical protein